MNCFEEPRKGFNFENFKRNQFLLSDKGHQEPNIIKTGTTICGLIFKDGVIIGSDTRSSSSDLIHFKDTKKIHFVQKNIAFAGSGVSADTIYVSRSIGSECELHRLNTGTQVPYIVAVTKLKQLLFRYQGHIGAYMIIGGIDRFGKHLSSISAYGSGKERMYCALGSGSLAALSILENGWKRDMELEDAKKLVRDAIFAGIFHDCASGNIIRIAIITEDRSEFVCFEDIPDIAKKIHLLGDYKFRVGTTKVLSTSEIKYETEEESVREIEPMDVQ